MGPRGLCPSKPKGEQTGGGKGRLAAGELDDESVGGYGGDPGWWATMFLGTMLAGLT